MSFNVPRGERKEPIFSRLKNRFDFSEFLAEKFQMTTQFPSGITSKIVFVFSLIAIYIFAQHRLETMMRSLDKAEREMKEKRASYISHQSEHMVNSKHSMVSIALEEAELHKNIEPPVKIISHQ